MDPRVKPAGDGREEGTRVIHNSAIASPSLPTVVPAHSASLRAFTPVFDGLWTRVNALILKIHIPETVVMGPRFRGDDSIMCFVAATAVAAARVLARAPAAKRPRW